MPSRPHASAALRSPPAPRSPSRRRAGPAAVATLKSDRPDLLLLDVMLPDDSGLTLARTLLRDSQLGQVPILLVTALPTMAQLEREAWEISTICRILYKHCRPRTILEVIDDVLRGAVLPRRQG